MPKGGGGGGRGGGGGGGTGGGGGKITSRTDTGTDHVTLVVGTDSRGRIRTATGRVVGTIFEAGSFDYRGRWQPSISGFTQDVRGRTLEQMRDSGGVIPGFVIRA